MRIQHKIFTSMALLILFIFITFGIVFYIYFKNQLLEQLTNENKTIAKTIEMFYVNENSNIASASDIKTLFTKHGFKWIDDYIIIISNDGSIEYANKDIPMEGRIKIISMYNNMTLTDNFYTVFSMLEEKQQLWTFYQSSKANAIILVISDLTILRNFENRFLVMVLQFIIAAIAISILVTALISKKIVHNLLLLKNAIIEAKRLNFNKKVFIKSNDEIGILAREYNQLIEKINEYDQSQKRFLQNVSHELKTPLTSIRGYAELLKQGGLNSEKKLYSIDTIINEVDRLKKIVNQIIDLSKIESFDGYFKFERVELNNIIFDTLVRLQAIFEINNIEVNFNPSKEIYINADVEQFSEALANILTNCIRYAKKKIDIECSSEQNKFILSIKDDGNGFKEEEIKKVFERFYKGKRGESGLGLSIAKAIVDKHNFQIEVRNHDEGGAMFIIKGTTQT